MRVLDWLKNRNNGNNVTEGAGNSAPTPHRIIPLEDSAEDAGQGPVLLMQIDLYELGRQRAISSGALQPREADILSLKEHAEAMARETRRDTYDPAKKHRVRETEYRKLLADREQAEDALKFSSAAVRDREQELARLPVDERPHAHPLLMWAIFIGIALTIAPTIHDGLFSTLEDSVLAGFFSTVCAGFLAVGIVWAILGSISATGVRTKANWVGLAAGIAISMGLGLFRLSSTEAIEEVGLAAALTIVEIGLVILAEYVAKGLRENFREWTTRRIARDLAEAALRAAQAEDQRRLAQVAALNEKVDRHVRFVEDLDLRNVNLQELIAQAVKAILDGYNDGIAYNRGHVVKAGR